MRNRLLVWMPKRAAAGEDPLALKGFGALGTHPATGISWKHSSGGALEAFL